MTDPILKPSWRVGFELEVVLNNLGLAQFSDGLEPMDTASPAYCQAVASHLRTMTGHPWSAPRTKRPRPGFYVVPEYDIDPIDFYRNMVAGVEIITPPLPIDEADALRRALITALDELEAWDNLDHEAIAERCGWHINVDAGPDNRLDPDRFALSADELGILARSGRLNNKYAAPQRHSYGAPLMRHLRDATALETLKVGLTNTLGDMIGEGKRYAANFAKLEHGYVELRHHNASTFVSDLGLEELLVPLLLPFEIANESIAGLEEVILDKLRVLVDWQDGHSHLIDLELRPSFSTYVGVLRFGGKDAARVFVDGTAEVSLMGSKRYEEPIPIRHLLVPDVLDGFALLALDVAELRARGIKDIDLKNRRLSKAIDRLADSLIAKGLATPPPILRSLWWK